MNPRKFNDERRAVSPTRTRTRLWRLSEEVLEEVSVGDSVQPETPKAEFNYGGL
jgi:hypothetical protein